MGGSHVHFLGEAVGSPYNLKVSQYVHLRSYFKSGNGDFYGFDLQGVIAIHIHV